MAVTQRGGKLKATTAYSWFKEARGYLSDPLKESEKDCNYYDNEQWTKEELEELEDRGQPPIVKNEIKAALDLVIGTETRLRVDFKAAPKSEAHVEDANVVTHLLKDSMDQCGGEYVFSEAFEAMMKPGWGFVEIYKERDPFKEPCQIRFIDRKNVFYDPYSKLWDLSDGKYVGRMKWLDLEDAQSMFPQYADDLKKAIDDEEFPYRQPYEQTGDDVDPHGSIFDWEDSGIYKKDWVDTARKRIRILEIWYKVPEEILILEDLITGMKEEFDPDAPGAIDKLIDPMTLTRNRNVEVYKASVRKVRFAMIAGPNVLRDDRSPFRHNHYPLIPFWGYRKDKDLTPYGLIRQMRSPQDEINKRASKALHVLNTAQVIADKRAIGSEDIEDLRREAARPDGVIINKSENGRLEILRDYQLADAQFKMMQDAKMDIERISGVGPDMKGQESDARSGKAILARQQQGNTILARPFDNYRRSRQRVGEILFATIQQFTTTAKVIRTMDQVGDYSFITINERIYDQETGQAYIRNDITRARVDIKIDEEEFSATVREALLEQMMELATKLPPEISLALLDLVIGYSDLPGRDEMVRRVQLIQQMIMGGVAVGGLQSSNPAASAAEAA